MKRAQLALLVLILSALPESPAESQSDSADAQTKVKFGGFVDTYYAFDFNRPRFHDRAFTTQAARHNEFNINLAHLEASIAAPRLRGRVAIQFGTSVQANYAAEPKVGTVSGSDVSRFVQEAVAGYRVASRVWIDAGIFLSSFGSESWISRDNWTYTRSLVAENSPYYESGIKTTWEVSKRLAAQLHLINGWQNISENNSDKAVGLRLDYTPSSRLSLSYDAFIGNEAPDTAASATRFWHEGILSLTPARRLEIRGTLDYGLQRNHDAGTSSFWGYSAIGRYAVSRKVHAAIRAERFTDDDQVIVVTGFSHGFRADGWSLNADFEPISRLLWRVELRQLNGQTPLFPSRNNDRSRRDRLVAASVALTL